MVEVTAGGLDTGGPLGRGRGLGPAVDARRMLLLVLLTGLLWLAWWALPSGDRVLADRYLAGARGPACVRVVVAVDGSGSMTDYAAARDAALVQLLAWSARNLREDDELAVVDFAATAADRLPVTAARALGNGAVPAAAPIDTGSTLLAPVLTAIGAQAPSRCDRALMLLSDGQLGDLPTDEAGGRAALAAHDVRDLALLVPGTSIDVPAEWSTAFPYAPPLRFDGHDPDATAVAFGEAVAAITGQTLATR